VQADASVLINEGLNTGEVSVRPIKLTIGNVYTCA
jgi:hypothetical protein